MTHNHQARLVAKLEPEAGFKTASPLRNNYIIMGTMLPCNRLSDTFDVDMTLCIICSSCGNELSKVLSAMKNSSSATVVVPSGGI